MVVKEAIGSRLKNIKHQILIEAKIKDRKEDCIFVTVPDLIRDCIVGIELLYDGRCILNFAQNKFHCAQLVSTRKYSGRDSEY